MLQQLSCYLQPNGTSVDEIRPGQILLVIIDHEQQLERLKKTGDPRNEADQLNNYMYSYFTVFI